MTEKRVKPLKGFTLPTIKTDAGFALLIPKNSVSLSLSRERARVRAASTQSLSYIHSALEIASLT